MSLKNPLGERDRGIRVRGYIVLGETSNPSITEGSVLELKNNSPSGLSITTEGSIIERILSLKNNLS